MIAFKKEKGKYWWYEPYGKNAELRVTYYRTPPDASYIGIYLAGLYDTKENMFYFEKVFYPRDTGNPQTEGFEHLRKYLLELYLNGVNVYKNHCGAFFKTQKMD
jgi:hypothetical protein